jgi:hypothetical protein
LSLFILIIIDFLYAFEFQISILLFFSLTVIFILLMLTWILVFLKVPSIWVYLLQILLLLNNLINVFFILPNVLLNIIGIKPNIGRWPVSSISLLVCQLDFDLIGLLKPIAILEVLFAIKLMCFIIIVVCVHSFPLVVQHISLKKLIIFQLYFPFYCF